MAMLARMDGARVFTKFNKMERLGDVS